MYYIFGIVIFFLSSVAIFSDVLGSNESYKKVRTKQLARKHSQRGCFHYVEVNGNRDWEEKRDKLNINIKNSDCKKIVIYKEIKNVNIRDKRDKKLLDIDVGTTINRKDKINVESITHIENSHIRGSYGNSDSSSNIGIRIISDKNRNIHLNNVKIKNSIKIEDSTVGNFKDPTNIERFLKRR